MRVVFLMIIFSFLGHLVASQFFSPDEVRTEAVAIDRELRNNGWIGLVFGAVVIGPAIEEALFRALLIGAPLAFLQQYSSLGYDGLRIAGWVFAVISSIIFGWAHGSPANILIQGSSGLVLAYIFMREGEYGKNFGRGFWASTIVHSTFNATLIALFGVSFLMK